MSERWIDRENGSKSEYESKRERGRERRDYIRRRFSMSFYYFPYISRSSQVVFNYLYSVNQFSASIVQSQAM